MNKVTVLEATYPDYIRNKFANSPTSEVGYYHFVDEKDSSVKNILILKNSVFGWHTWNVYNFNDVNNTLSLITSISNNDYKHHSDVIDKMGYAILSMAEVPKIKESPCILCHRKNDIGVAKCWWGESPLIK